jgi:integrase
VSTDRAAASSNDAIDRFLEELTFHGKTERTRAAYERVLRRFEAFLADPAANPADRALPPDAAGRRECMAWIHTLRGDLEPSTVATYAAYLHRCYAYMTEVGEFDNNPMTVVREEMDERIDTDPTRREIAVPEMREFVARLTHPLDRALVVTLLKTGMRVGELCNLDLRDVTMTGKFGAYDLGGRAQLDGRGDSLYVASDIARGDAINGEDRTAANKRKRGTVVPVDDELAVVLREWLAIRPNAVSPAEPLFCSTGDEWGQRVTPSMVRSRVKDTPKQSAGTARVVARQRTSHPTTSGTSSRHTSGTEPGTVVSSSTSAATSPTTSSTPTRTTGAPGFGTRTNDTSTSCCSGFFAESRDTSRELRV